MDRRSAQGQPAWTVELLLDVLVEQVLAIKPRSDNDLSIFMRLLGLAFSQSQGHLRRYLNEMYGHVFQRYMLLLREVAPEVQPIELFWRVHFMIGAAAFSMSGLKALREIVVAEYDVHLTTEQVLRLMVPFLAAGLRADSVIDEVGMQPAIKNKTS